MQGAWQVTWPCKCHTGNGPGPNCRVPNFGEMESLTCQIKPLESS